MKHRPLSGSDQFHLLLDRKMLRNGSVGNISRIHLELIPTADLDRIADRLSRNETFRAVSELKVVHRWPFLPKWETEKGNRKNVAAHSDLSRSEFNETVLNRKVDNERGLVFIDLCQLEDGSKHVVISMHNVLFDHQGMVNFLHALADGTRTFPFFPEEENRPLLQTFRNAAFMTVYMLGRSSWKLGTLVGKNVRPRSTPRFKVIQFTSEETEQIAKRAWEAGARIGQSAFHITVTAQTVLKTLMKRNENPPYLWFSVPHDQRRKGTSGHLVSNQLSFLFFRLTNSELRSTESAVNSFNQQLKMQIKDRITDRYTDLLTALRYMPMAVYEGMVDLASNGKVSSFGYSDLGEEREPITEFQGAVVLRKFHYPPIPCPPGFSVIARRSNGQQQFIWAYFDEVVSETEIARMEAEFRVLLLGVA